jgi:RHS repeat-associated protein
LPHPNSRYDAFGENIGGTGAVSNKYLFAGEQYDQNLGDYYLRARYYDTDSGRFTRRDVYEGNQNEPLTLHKYVYTHNNPVNGIDPSGLFTNTLLEQAAVAASIAALAVITWNIINTINNPIEKAYDAADLYASYFPHEVKDKLTEGAKRSEKNKKSEKSEEWDKDGGFDKANEDFNEVAKEHGGTVKQDPNNLDKRTATFPDGTTVNVRRESTDGRATVQVDNMPNQGKKHVKIRYNP